MTPKHSCACSWTACSLDLGCLEFCEINFKLNKFCEQFYVEYVSFFCEIIFEVIYTLLCLLGWENAWFKYHFILPHSGTKHNFSFRHCKKYNLCVKRGFLSQIPNCPCWFSNMLCLIGFAQVQHILYRLELRGLSGVVWWLTIIWHVTYSMTISDQSGEVTGQRDAVWF